MCKRVAECGAKILKGLEGPRGGRAWLAGRGKILPTLTKDYSILVPFVNDYFKCFVCYRIAERVSSGSGINEEAWRGSPDAAVRRLNGCAIRVSPISFALLTTS